MIYEQAESSRAAALSQLKAWRERRVQVLLGSEESRTEKAILDLDAAVRRVAEEWSRKIVDHPSRNELANYARGAVPTAEDEERVQEHLTLCRECAEVVLDRLRNPV